MKLSQVSRRSQPLLDVGIQRIASCCRRDISIEYSSERTFGRLGAGHLLECDETSGL